MDMPMPPGATDAPPSPDASAQVSAYAQQIADAAKNLPPEDLKTLMQGISPEALEVMEKIPDLGAFANLIESGGVGTAEDDDGATPSGGKPGVAVIIGVGRGDPRSDVRRAVQQHGMR
jgi:hypothetical protein